MSSDLNYAAIVAAPVGLLGVRMRAGELAGIDFSPPSDAVAKAPDPATREVLDQLFRYFENPAWRFQLALASGGTPFQRRVRQALVAIPCGCTRSYGELARELGSSARAVV